MNHHRGNIRLIRKNLRNEERCRGTLHFCSFGQMCFLFPPQIRTTTACSCSVEIIPFFTSGTACSTKVTSWKVWLSWNVCRFCQSSHLTRAAGEGLFTQLWRSHRRCGRFAAHNLLAFSSLRCQLLTDGAHLIWKARSIKATIIYFTVEQLKRLPSLPMHQAIMACSSR